VINCWAKSDCKDAPEATLKLLRKMPQQYLSGDNSFRPNTITYSTVISASAQAGQAERLDMLLQQM
jgi:pentatricopeptide repeat protein